MQLGIAPGDAFGADAVILLQRGFQQPEQAVVFRQDESALAGQRLRQGTQVFFLDEIAVDHIRLGQLIAELLQIKCLSERRQAQQRQRSEAFEY